MSSVKPESARSSLEWIIQPAQHDLGGFYVRRALPDVKRRMVGPWIFFDHFGPAEFEPGKGIDVRPHPHINLATVTYLFEGEMLHRDSLGNELAIKPGEVNLMVAGRGIVHSERQRPEVKASGNRIHGLQLWLALPEADEEIAPEFHHFASGQIPGTEFDAIPVRVMIGEAYGLRSPVRAFADSLYLEARMQAGQVLRPPDSVEECAVYVVHGTLRCGGQEIAQHTMAVFVRGQTPGLEAVEDALIVLIGGGSLGKRHIWWNFVSSRKQRIEQAKRDWSNGAFPKVPGDEIEFIPLPDS